jgi:hypothetical protein
LVSQLPGTSSAWQISGLVYQLSSKSALICRRAVSENFISPPGRFAPAWPPTTRPRVACYDAASAFAACAMEAQPGAATLPITHIAESTPVSQPHRRPAVSGAYRAGKARGRRALAREFVISYAVGGCGHPGTRDRCHDVKSSHRFRRLI